MQILPPIGVYAQGTAMQAAVLHQLPLIHFPMTMIIVTCYMHALGDSHGARCAPGPVVDYLGCTLHSTPYSRQTIATDSQFS